MTYINVIIDNMGPLSAKKASFAFYYINEICEYLNDELNHTLKMLLFHAFVHMYFDNFIKINNCYDTSPKSHTALQ